MLCKISFLSDSLSSESVFHISIASKDLIMLLKYKNDNNTYFEYIKKTIYQIENYLESPPAAA